MVRGPMREGSQKRAGPLGALFLPLVAMSLLVSCADRTERPNSCPDKRPVPILY